MWQEEWRKKVLQHCIKIITAFFINIKNEVSRKHHFALPVDWSKRLHISSKDCNLSVNNTQETVDVYTLEPPTSIVCRVEWGQNPVVYHRAQQRQGSKNCSECQTHRACPSHHSQSNPSLIIIQSSIYTAKTCGKSFPCTTTTGLQFS